MLADLLDCLLFWNSVTVAIMLDIQKAYQAICMSLMELHLWRFLFRDNPADQWQTYGYARANFGNMAAGLILEVAKRLVTDMGCHIDLVAANQLENQAYVDDVVMGDNEGDIIWMRGECGKDGYMGTVAWMLSMGGMTVKFMSH